MELLPKLLAAADMCEAGEQVNLDETAFLLRYAADELKQESDVRSERDRLLQHRRERLEALCELTGRAEADFETSRHGTLDALETLEALIDHELRSRFGEQTLPESENHAAELDVRPFKAGVR
ncbi:hypothetical protein GF324_07955 [bacterium]|nr:hypothetical protein [bacterium]